MLHSLLCVTAWLPVSTIVFDDTKIVSYILFCTDCIFIVNLTVIKNNCNTPSTFAYYHSLIYIITGPCMVEVISTTHN